MNTVRYITASQTAKNIRKFLYPRIFCDEFSIYFKQPVPYMFVSVNRRNNEARAHTAYMENSPQNIRRHTDIFFTVQRRFFSMTDDVVSSQHVITDFSASRPDYRCWLPALVTASFYHS